MSLDWYPAIRECCAYWSDAPMLHQTFEALEKSFSSDNDACIDCAKSIVEVICLLIVEELDDPLSSVKPTERNPSFGTLVSAAVRALKLGDIRHDTFRKLVSEHHKLTTVLGDLRNNSGPVSHGKEGFIERLSGYHRRSAVLSADAIVAFLHQAYRESALNLVRTREPYERFQKQNELIDAWCRYFSAEIDEDGLLAVTLQLPTNGISQSNEANHLVIDVSPSQFLFSLDRQAYIEALNEAQSAEVNRTSSEESGV